MTEEKELLAPQMVPVSLAQTVPSKRTNSPYRVYVTEVWYELLKLSRAKSFVLSMLGFPVVFFLLFGVSNRAQMFHGYSVARYLLVSYSCFGCMGAAFFGVGANVAYERGHGWLDLKRASPMPTAAYLLSKFVASLAFGLLITFTLLVIGVLTVPMELTALEILNLVASNAFGVFVFGTIGLFLGLLMPPESAAGMINFVYLPLSLCAGLWMPLEALPHWMQVFARILPSYYYSRLSLHALGYFDEPVLPGMAIMLANAVVFILLSAWVFRRQEMRH